MRLRELGELQFLRRLRRGVTDTSEPVLLGVGDDAAVLACPEGQALVVTCDAAVDGHHFQREWFSPSEIGGRAVAAAISDLAAMGARPAAVLLTLLISPDEDADFARAVVAGADGTADALGGQLAGGETVGADMPLTLDVMFTGFVPVGRELRRSGARPGDALLVSGTLGDSAAGLAALRARVTGERTADSVISRYKLPQPRLALGCHLAESGVVHAAIDISDGLARDADHIAEQSGVAIRIDRDAIPLSPACRAVAESLSVDPLRWAIGGGEDFELLFTVERSAVTDLARSVEDRVGLRVTRIGEVLEGEGVHICLADGSEVALPSAGWDQFAHG
jgi:thiamine-monophosphate kinase